MKSTTKQVLLILSWAICLIGTVVLPNVKPFFEVTIGGITGYAISFVKAKGDKP